MKLTRTDTKHMLRALLEAIESREALIDCHRTEYYGPQQSDGDFKRIIPKEYRADMARVQRQIDAWRKLYQKIKAERSTH